MLKLGGFGRLKVTQGHSMDHTSHMTFHSTLTETFHLMLFRVIATYLLKVANFNMHFALPFG